MGSLLDVGGSKEQIASDNPIVQLPTFGPHFEGICNQLTLVRFVLRSPLD